MPRLVLSLALLVTLDARAAAPADLWERWAVSDGRSKVVVTHSAFDAWLQRYVVRSNDGTTWVRYGAVTPADRASLSRYVDHLEAQQPTTLRKREQLAYWINLYNAATLELVLAHYPIDSIRKLDRPWDQKLLTVEGEPLSLNDVEHRILRPIFKDPRVHYALNCASVGCPNLQERAFRGSTITGRLDMVARGFVTHPRAITFEGDKLVVSSIYHWFGTDFGDGQAAVLAHLLPFVRPELRKRLEKRQGYDEHRYDWRLNDAEPVTAK